jgi:hypothetical protein
MIAFDLICSNGHIFECWFKDSASFEKQKSAGIIDCPICEDHQVEKVFSPFAVKKNGEREKEKTKVDPNQVIQMVQQYVEKHFEDVGADFTSEALKIHFGQSKKRNIKGTATTHQETLLREEGVQFFKIPIVKRQLN